DVDPAIEAICLKAMAKEPDRRFLSMAELAQALEDYLQGRAKGRETPEQADPFEQVAAGAVLQLRTWGWFKGIERLKVDHARASTAHQWGFWYYRQGRLDEALDRLHAALDLSGCDHYVTAFLLDQFGLVYWRKNNFPAALDFFRLAAARLGRFKDEQSVVQPL